MLLMVLAYMYDDSIRKSYYYGPAWYGSRDHPSLIYQNLIDYARLGCLATAVFTLYEYACHSVSLIVGII